MALREGDAGIAGVIAAAGSTGLETMMKTPGLHLYMPDHLQSVHARSSAVNSITSG